MIDLDFSQAISKIESYQMERPVDNDLRRQSYSEWAIEEILARLMYETQKEPELLRYEGRMDPKDVVEYFYLEMEYLEDTSDTLRQRLIFSIARQETEHVLTIL